MDIVPVSTVTVPRKCGEVRCGQCEPCRVRAMKNTAAYALKEEDPQGALLELLSQLGLISGV